MQIKRTTEIFIETRRRLVIRQPEQEGEPVACPACGEPLMDVTAAAALFGMSHRAVYRLVEQTAVHFAETETGALLLCPSSLAKILEGDAQQLTTE